MKCFFYVPVGDLIAYDFQRDIRFEPCDGESAYDVFYAVESRSLIWPAVDALARKEGIAQIVPGSVETGQVEVENKHEVVFIGTEIVDITAVYGKYLSGSHCYVLMTGHDIDASILSPFCRYVHRHVRLTQSDAAIVGADGYVVVRREIVVTEPFEGRLHQYPVLERSPCESDL